MRERSQPSRQISAPSSNPHVDVADPATLGTASSICQQRGAVCFKGGALQRQVQVGPRLGARHTSDSCHLSQSTCSHSHTTGSILVQALHSQLFTLFLFHNDVASRCWRAVNTRFQWYSQFINRTINKEENLDFCYITSTLTCWTGFLVSTERGNYAETASRQFRLNLHF